MNKWPDEEKDDILDDLIFDNTTSMNFENEENEDVLENLPKKWVEKVYLGDLLKKISLIYRMLCTRALHTSNSH